jgi:hypothetical protein
LCPIADLDICREAQVIWKRIVEAILELLRKPQEGEPVIKGRLSPSVALGRVSEGLTVYRVRLRHLELHLLNRLRLHQCVPIRNRLTH